MSRNASGGAGTSVPGVERRAWRAGSGAGEVAGAAGSACAGPAAGAGSGFAGAGDADWPRSPAIFCLRLASWVLNCSHPEVAIANSAHVHSVLRRISSLHGEKDTGAVLAAQHRSVAPLRVRHDPHHIPAGARDPGDGVRRPVRVLARVAPDDAAAGLELGRRAGVTDVAPFAWGDRELQHGA